MTYEEIEMDAFKKWIAIPKNRKNLDKFHAFMKTPEARFGAYHECLNLKRGGGESSWADGKPMVSGL